MDKNKIFKIVKEEWIKHQHYKSVLEENKKLHSLLNEGMYNPMGEYGYMDEYGSKDPYEEMDESALYEEMYDEMEMEEAYGCREAALYDVHCSEGNMMDEYGYMDEDMYDMYEGHCAEGMYMTSEGHCMEMKGTHNPDGGMTLGGPVPQRGRKAKTERTYGTKNRMYTFDDENSLEEQQNIHGCADPQAINYDPNALGCNADPNDVSCCDYDPCHEFENMFTQQGTIAPNPAVIQAWCEDHCWNPYPTAVYPPGLEICECCGPNPQSGGAMEFCCMGGVTGMGQCMQVPAGMCNAASLGTGYAGGPFATMQDCQSSGCGQPGGGLTPGCTDNTAMNFDPMADGCPDPSGMPDPNDMSCCDYPTPDYGFYCKPLGNHPKFGSKCTPGTAQNPGNFATLQDCLSSGCEPLPADMGKGKTPFRGTPPTSPTLISESKIKSLSIFKRMKKLAGLKKK